MDELKSKVLDFIQLKGQQKVPIVGNVEDFSLEEPESSSEVQSSNVVTEQQPSDQEILDTIDEQYFSKDSDFDASRYELQKVTSLDDAEGLEESLSKLRQQHSVVSNHVLQMILEKQSASQLEFCRVTELEGSIKDVVSTVRSARKELGRAKSCITTAGVAVLSNTRRRTHLRAILSYLKAISALRKKEVRGEERLEEGDLPGAISLLKDCLRAAGSYRHFSCVEDLITKIQDTIDMAEKTLDQTSANVCYNFDELVYSGVYRGYEVLGKGQDALDQLLRFYSLAVHNSAYATVLGFLPDSTAKPSYPELCKMVCEENFISCLCALCKSLWNILLSYHQLLTWHLARINNSPNKTFENGYTVERDRQKLEEGRYRLWNDVQSNVSCLVLSTSLANHKFDDFLHVLALLHRMSQVGEEICGDKASLGAELANSVRTQSQDYFSRFHASRLEDLRAFVDNEPWTPCPVRKHFNFLHLQEWKGLRSAVERCASRGSLYTSDSSSIETGSQGTGPGYFLTHPDPNRSTPFDSTCLLAPSATEEHILKDSDYEQGSGGSSEGSDDEMSDRVGSNLVSNTTLTVLRLCGKYLQMARYLDTIVDDVVLAVRQLFEYYLYTVYTRFSTDDKQVGQSWYVKLPPKLPSIKLNAVLRRIEDTLIFPASDESKMLGCGVDLTGDLAGLEVRALAVESLMFLSEQYLLLRPYLEQILPNSSHHKLSQFYLTTVNVSEDVRGPVYWYVACSAINYKRALTAMANVDWELKDVMSQHSPYVDTIFLEISDFSKKISSMKIAGTTPLPKPVILSLWDSIAFSFVNLFVEGFSSSSKCSNGGRALMQLDWAQLLSKVSKLCPLRRIPYVSLVDNYVKAYYQQEQELLNWIKQHYTEYSYEQLTALILSACQSDKKSKQRVITALEELRSSVSMDMSASPSDPLHR